MKINIKNKLWIFMIKGGSNHNDDSVNEYKKVKEEMNRLGFTSYKEYMDYL